jgi:hypothetical protein
MVERIGRRRDYLHELVTFMLSANSKVALKNAEPAFLAIRSKY